MVTVLFHIRVNCGFVTLSVCVNLITSIHLALQSSEEYSVKQSKCHANKRSTMIKSLPFSLRVHIGKSIRGLLHQIQTLQLTFYKSL